MIYCNILSGYFELNFILNLDDEIDELVMEKAIECLENQVREMPCALLSIFSFQCSRSNIWFQNHSSKNEFLKLSDTKLDLFMYTCTCCVIHTQQFIRYFMVC